MAQWHAGHLRVPQVLSAVVDVQGECPRSRPVGFVIGVQDTLDALPQPQRAGLAHLPTAVARGEGGG